MSVAAKSVPTFDEAARLTKELPETDGFPLETPWHLAAICLLIELLTFRWRDRRDFFVGGNMFLYYSLRASRSEDFRGPDFFYVAAVDGQRPREYWAVWDENGKYPNLIVEFLSRSTAMADRTTKKDLCEQTFRTPEYYCFDPETNHLEGWHLHSEHYRPCVPDERGWIWSETLQLWLGTWTGTFHGQTATWLRLYDAAGVLVPLGAEAERQRAEAAEAELARVKVLLAQQGLKPDNPG